MPLAIVTMSGVTPQFSKPQKCVARAAETRLHFVGNAQSAVPADDVIDDLVVFRRRRNGAAGALNRFGDEAGRIARTFRSGSTISTSRAQRTSQLG